MGRASAFSDRRQFRGDGRNYGNAFAKSRRIYFPSSFNTEGMEKFDEAYQNGIFDKLLTTNLVYQTPELLSKPYYITCDMSKYIALIIDTLNHDMSVSHLLNPADRIKRCVSNYMAQYEK